MARVLLIGRPNVGKSTFFNRILGRRKAIVDGQSGTTRDWQSAQVQWRGTQFLLIDAGGVPGAKDPISLQVQKQVEQLIPESDLLVFMGDAKEGLTSADFELADWIRKRNKRVLWVINKVDERNQEFAASEFYKLGTAQIFSISALHGRGVADVLDEIVRHLPSVPHEKPETSSEDIRIAVVGRPNVGKSTLVNHLVGRQRVLVHETPGTTRDTIEVPFQWKGQSFILVDTAGVRARAKRKTPVEFFSVSHTQTAILESQLIFFLIEAPVGLIRDDLKILHLIQKSEKPCLLLINKWDQAKGIRFSDYENLLRSRMMGLTYIPILAISALSGRGTAEVFSHSQQILKSLERSIPTPAFNKFLEEVQKNPKAPMLSLPSRVKFYYGCQIKKNPPVFQIVTNFPQRITQNYERWFYDQIRHRFGLTYQPVRIKWRGRDGKK